MDFLSLIGRREALFDADLESNRELLENMVSGGGFLVIGGGGSIGRAISREIFKRHPRKLHVVDVSENNLVELVRDIRSTIGYINGDFKTFAIDCGGVEFEALLQAEGPYDFVLNLSALKHVRSERDPFTLMRMIRVNIINTLKTVELAGRAGAKKYFCVSTDKAANPVNMMGASKRIMEKFLTRESDEHSVSMARFANVAFSDGSLLDGFNQRIIKHQPISAPKDVRRYFVTPQESGELCLMSCLFGENRDIFFPKLSEKLHLITFSEIAQSYLESHGYEPYLCKDEEEARSRAGVLISQKRWPCHFFVSDTTGEKDFEEFFTDSEVVDTERFKSIGVIKSEARYDSDSLNAFYSGIEELLERTEWEKEEIVSLFEAILPNFDHKETGKYLDQRM